MDQIDFPYFKRFSEKKFFEKKKNILYVDDIKKDKDAKKYKVGDGVWLSFLPVYDKDVFDDDIVESFKIFLINQTNEAYNFTYTIAYAGAHDFKISNQISPLSDFYIHDVPFEEMNDAPRFNVDFSLIRIDKNNAEHFESIRKNESQTIVSKDRRDEDEK